jgi:putative addiction module component (TIGR02574 family)
MHIALSNINELRALPPNEKFQIIEMLWDDLIADSGNVSSPAWHEVELLQTEAAYQAGHIDALMRNRT